MPSLRSNPLKYDDRDCSWIGRESSNGHTSRVENQARMKASRTRLCSLLPTIASPISEAGRRSRWALTASLLGLSTLAWMGCSPPSPIANVPRDVVKDSPAIESLSPPDLVSVKPVGADAEADYQGHVTLPGSDWRFARDQPMASVTSSTLASAGRSSELPTQSVPSDQELYWTLQSAAGTKPKKAASESPSDDSAKKTAAKKPVGQFDGEVDWSQIDLSEDASTEKSASDLGKVELVPTPVAQKEIEAEIVPTPLGMPENHPSKAAMAKSAGGPVASIAGRATNERQPDAAPTDLDLSLPENIVAKRPVNETSNSNGSTSTDLDLRAASDVNLQLTAPDSPIIQGLVDAETVAGGTSEPEDYDEWPEPALTLFVTGQQHGYIEPCGCTGLENQKGGVARRMTFLKQLREKGWEMAPIDAGNLVRRYGRQSEIKFHRSLEALRTMGYVSVGLGPDDVRLSVNELILEASPGDPDEAIYVSANVIPFDRSLMPTHRVIEKGGMKLAVTTVLDPDSLETKLSDDIQMTAPIDSAKEALAEIQKQNPDYTVLTFYGDEKTAHELVRAVPGFDLVVIAGGYGEPTYQPQTIEGSQTKAILTGDKGMYAGLVGLYPDGPIRYARVPLTHEFEDAPEMRELMKDYQFQLRDLGLENLGLKPIQHPSGDKFVGAKVCGECHTTAYDIWEGSAHFEATEHLVNPGERGDVPRHFDPECISCHVTGWNPQGYYPYVSGYLDLEASAHLHGNGCENCHGPGAAHTAAEREDSGVSEAEKKRLREAMQLPLEEARESCMQCHDLDNSPDFHVDGAFNDYWAEIEHYGVD